jgi:hypothetical protein
VITSISQTAQRLGLTTAAIATAAVAVRAAAGDLCGGGWWCGYSRLARYPQFGGGGPQSGGGGGAAAVEADGRNLTYMPIRVAVLIWRQVVAAAAAAAAVYMQADPRRRLWQYAAGNRSMTASLTAVAAATYGVMAAAAAA